MRSGMNTTATSGPVETDRASQPRAGAMAGWTGIVDASLSYARGPADVPLLDETIGERLRDTIARFGDREALVDPSHGVRWTWVELGREVELVARGLLARGVEKGARVGIWAPNRPEWVVVQFATARIGAILVNVNPAYKASELEYALQRAGVSTLVLSHGFRQTDYEELLAGVRRRCPLLRDALVLERDWADLLVAGAGVDLAELEAREDTLSAGEAINIQYTSGTTGFPKGATLSHRNILNNAYFAARQLGYTERDRVCVPVPFYHCFGMVLGTLACMTCGATLVVPGESFEPAAVLETVAAERCTSLYGVPTMFIAELEEPRFDEFDLSSLRTGIMAGAPCPVETMNEVRSRMHMAEVTIGCGMTETSPLATQTAPDDPVEKRVTTVGRPHPHVEVKVIDTVTGDTVPHGVAGEQCMRGYNVMLGYWDDDEATRAAVDEGGWMHSGDLATMDADGYVDIVGRIKDMIIRGGENIYPREIEEFLMTLPGVAEAYVVGVPSARYGEEVMAWIRPHEGAAPTEDALVAACKGRIATVKIPRFWRFVDAFPMTVTGKVQKYRLREEAAELDLAGAGTPSTAPPDTSAEST
jgi:fatty-acyl-CoA synthase